MDAYEMLLKTHRIGSKISGTVIACDEPSFGDGMVVGDVRVKTETAYPALLPYSQMVDEPSSFTPNMVPRVGARIDAVVFNFVNGHALPEREARRFVGSNDSQMARILRLYRNAYDWLSA